jgi:hypothetical protein
LNEDPSKPKRTDINDAIDLLVQNDLIEPQMQGNQVIYSLVDE